MQKKKTRKVRHAIINVLMVGVFITAVYLLFQVALEIIATVQLNNQLTQVEEHLEEIQNEHQYLSEQKDKLLDPEYVKNYARAGFMLSKDGEQIFFLPQADDDE